MPDQVSATFERNLRGQTLCWVKMQFEDFYSRHIEKKALTGVWAA